MDNAAFRIAVVDDEENILETVGFALRREGFRVDTFADGLEAWQACEGALPDLAVLDVLEEEGLREHAREVGAHFRRGLEGLGPRHPVIGDVRGPGLFLGVEMVRPGDGPLPHRDAARYVVGRMKEKGILLSTDGPDDNVIKIKPPLPFSRRDVDRVVEVMDQVLGEDGART